MFGKVLVANRGAIACRIARSLRRMGVASVAVYSDADRYSLHVDAADEAVRLGSAPAVDSYLSIDKILSAARLTGAQAIHPGYGFLSENAGFAAACEAAGLTFIGPTPKQLRDFGSKHTARELAAANGLPLSPGSGLLADLAAAEHAAEAIGFPLMIKSTAGGGGIGMQLCRSAEDFSQAFASVVRLAGTHFGEAGVFVERYIESARHIEVQIFGDGRGQVVSLGERDCSLQRRNQKMVEETPAPNLSDATREALQTAAVRLGRAVSYRSAGTVEFVYDTAAQEFYFLEVNTRLQVEHGVTEEVTGIDLVEWMVRTAAGAPPDLAAYRQAPRGHSVQVRLYAEEPAKNFRPSSGLLTEVRWPDKVRVETAVAAGLDVPPFYDPMLAKLISHAPTREGALDAMGRALEQTSVSGVETNLVYLRAIVDDPGFRGAWHSTRTLSHLSYQPNAVEVRKPGTFSTVQDYPGRVGYWNIGVPPSGPMDDLAFRFGNRLLGNKSAAPALELTVSGPELLFTCDTVFALTGAHMLAELDGKAVPYWQPVLAKAGAVLAMRDIRGAGQRAYLAAKGGFDVPNYMGSAATFTLGQFGGPAGRALRAGDTLRLHAGAGEMAGCAALPSYLVPRYAAHWDIEVNYGPHGAPDFFTPGDIREFFATAWTVHYNSSRTGVRLIGPKPHWARADGGEAGLHPSNIHDNAYAVGSIDFTGDMPVILGPDGPSLGGFVCPATIVRADLWKVGQLRPGDSVRFHCISPEDAAVRDNMQNESIESLTPPKARPKVFLEAGTTTQCVLAQLPSAPNRVAVTYRQAGDRNILIEYGPPVLDLALRFRVEALMRRLEQHRIPGVRELTPGIRSLQVQFAGGSVSQASMLAALMDADSSLPPVEAMQADSRIVHLPLSWNDTATQLAIDKYMQSVRADAPWCPSNIEFIRRINGLDSIDAVRRIVFAASYLVLGLGDVYLGAPVATPLDPRHRLVTTKYNPARTWTPENAVGIGGAYLCVYGMEGPGGYQFVGRTLQMWNRYRQTKDFCDGKQWLLRFFDQIRFFPVSEADLLDMRSDFLHGRYRLQIEHSTLRLADYLRQLETDRDSIAAFKARQQAAFEAERERWSQLPPNAISASDAEPGAIESAPIPAGCEALLSPVTGSVWAVQANVGERVKAGQTLAVIEAMKMEVPIASDSNGQIVELRLSKGGSVTNGDVLIVLRPDG